MGQGRILGKSRVLCVIVGLFLGVMASQALAADEDMAAKLKQLEQRLNQQDKVIGDLRSELADTKKGAMSREDMVRIAKELDANSKEHSLPGWLDNLKFYGDLRLRYQGEDYNWGSGDSEKKNRNRARFRLRFGVVKTWLEDQLEVGFRLASGDSETPTSTNQTFTDGYSKKKVWIDLAYARYSPKQVPGLSVIGGKMKNPWLMNEIFFDSDVNPEGFWAEYKPPCPGPVQPFVGAGYFIFKESSSGFDTIVFGPQAGLTWKISEDYAWTTAAYYQDWDHYDDSGASAMGNNSPLSSIPGFGVIGITNSLDFKVCKLPVKVFLDWAHNCDEADSTENYEGDNNAYAVGVQVGKNKKKGDWSLKYAYAYVQANSLPGAIADADFGSVNRQGHKVCGEYNLLDNLTVGVTLFLTQPIFSPTTISGSSATEDDTVTVQADLVWKF
jgi:hypothetical protein